MSIAGEVLSSRTATETVSERFPAMSLACTCKYQVPSVEAMVAVAVSVNSPVGEVQLGF